MSTVGPWADAVALITGAGGGIGRAIAEGMAARGIGALVLMDLSAAAAKAAAEELQRAFPNLELHVVAPADVSSPEQAAEAVKKAAELVAPRRLRVLVNNAGITSGKTLLELSPQELRKVFEVNALGPLWMTKAVLPEMIQANGGLVLGVSSLMSQTGAARLVPYCSSKWAHLGAMEALRMEATANRWPVRFVTVCPYIVSTEMFKDAFKGWDCPGREFLFPALRPEEVAAGVISAMESSGPPMVVIPWHIGVAFELLRFVPAALGDFAQGINGGWHGMDSFSRHEAAK